MWIEFHGLTFDLPDGWFDFTNEVDGNWPPTLAQAEASGVIQFSVARYASGKLPGITMDDLRQFCVTFCEQHGINPGGISEVDAHLPCAGVRSEPREEVIAAWYLSNGADVAFVTYISYVGQAEEHIEKQLADALSLVKTAGFVIAETSH